MTIHSNDSQVMLILNHLKTGAEINPLMAIKKYDVYRLGAVIYILKREGHPILSRLEYFDKPSGRKGHYAVYRLEVAEDE